MEPVTVAAAGALLAAYVAVGVARPAARRATEAREIRDLVLEEIAEGRRHYLDDGVPDLLAWCDAHADRPA